MNAYIVGSSVVQWTCDHSLSSVREDLRENNYSLQDVKVESIVKACVGRNSLAWLLLIHSLLQMVLTETMATLAFCHALYEWEKKQQKYAGQDSMGVATCSIFSCLLVHSQGLPPRAWKRMHLRLFLEQIFPLNPSHTYRGKNMENTECLTIDCSLLSWFGCCVVELCCPKYGAHWQWESNFRSRAAPLYLRL